MSENKIEISVKDIPEIIEQLKDLEKELEFERKSKNLFIDDLYKVCEMSLKLQNQLQQKENIIKEVREYTNTDKNCVPKHIKDYINNLLDKEVN